MEYILQKLTVKKDEKYRLFQAKLIPTVNPNTIIGVRTPELRLIAKEVSKDERCRHFLDDLPHQFFDENQLHAFIISEIKNFDECIVELEKFLPYIDNWATCDQTSPKVFKKNKEKLLEYIDKWLCSNYTYTVRFAIGMLMQHYLDDEFKVEYIKKVTSIKSEEYYINMEIGWYLATSLAKQWESTIPFIEDRKLDKWVQNCAIQKARDSRRITSEQKEYLKSFKK